MEILNEEKFEDELINKLQKVGWIFKSSVELERDSYEEPLLLKNLINAIKKINNDLDLEEINRAITELKLKSSGPEGVKQVLYALKHGITIKSKRGRDLKPVHLFDYRNLDNNEYLVSRQVVYRSNNEIIIDIILYVNGIPLVNIELKNPTSFSESWLDAYDQIKRYEKMIPELYKYVQIGVAAEAHVRYFPIVPWIKDIRTYEWKEISKNSVGSEFKEDSINPVDSIIQMLSRDRILDIIKNYIFFREEAGLETKVITRYMQYIASEKMVQRVLGHLSGEEEKNHGLIWHWQGSGKTLTMIFAANKLYQLKELENPSIFFIVDRRDLRDQLYQEFTALDAIQPELINSIDELISTMQHDELKGKRGVFISLVHKFKPEKLTNTRKELKKLSEKGWNSISTRSNVVVFVDEAHRTQNGNLAGQMRDILKSGFFFGFTGTPILKKDRNTYSNFAYPPEEYYLHRYFITDSIKDGFTVKIVYQPRLEEFHLNKKMLKIFADLQFEEIPEQIRDDVESGVKNRLNAINLFLENEERIKLVAKDLARHFEENIQNKFKAMVVAPSRKACVYYKKALDEYLPSDYSEVIMSYDKKDDEVIKDFEEELRSKYNGKDPEEIKKEVVENFKDEEELPKILIVTDMLLTGFDAPILQTMYLDKPLKEHRLLQAIARTNRPFKDVKEAGYIIDYVGVIKDELKRAFDIYAEEEIEGAIYDMPAMRNQFKSLMDENLSLFGDKGESFNRESILNAFEVLTVNDEKAEKFVNNYRNLRRLFEFLGPDYIKLDRLEDYKWLSAVYVYYRKMVSSNPALDQLIRKYYDKTIKFVHRTSEFEQFEDNLPEITFDEHYIDNLEKNFEKEDEKAANIVFTLNKLVLVDSNRKPVYESVADKVERVLNSWKAKTKDYRKIYLEGVEVVKEIEELSNRQNKLDFNDLEYSLLIVLEENLGENSSFINDVKKLSEILAKDTFEGWNDQRSVSKKIERELQIFLRKHYYKEFNMDRKSLEELRKQLMAKVEEYAK
ncbi:MAG: type I restriction endonuclease subunit R [Methanobacterium sp.]